MAGEDDLPRVPPGQVVSQDWPVLHHGEIPKGPDPWTLRLWGAVRRPQTLTLAALRHLGAQELDADVHCVSGWSLLDGRWWGLPFSRLEELAGPLPQAGYLMAHAAGGWTTNIALSACRHPGVMVIWARDGVPLSAAHGGPLRLFIPHLYFWKSAKWLMALEWMVEDRPVFWERNTKYTTLDPWHAVRGGARG